MSQTIYNYIEMIKPRITLLVLLTGYLGYYLGLRHISSDLYMVERSSIISFLHLVVGTFLTSSGSAILNQYKEKDLDKLMDRTKNRPLPSNKIEPKNALFLGVIFCFIGFIYLIIFVNLITSLKL